MIDRLLSEQGILNAIGDGSLRENRYMEVKTRLAAPADRREIARDLASFALDGGVIVFGIQETSDEELLPLPFPLARESERIENIAANSIEPPLSIRVHSVSSAADPAVGYLVVEIPASPLAPHMVEHQYWARAERTKRRLGDPEVVRLHAQRTALEDRVEAALDEELAREPSPRPRARMFLVAVPLMAGSRMAASFTRGTERSMIDLTSRAEAGVPQRMWDWSPQVHELSYAVRRSQGLARTNLRNGRTTVDESEAEFATEIEVQTSGSVRAFMTGFHHLMQIRRVEGDSPVVTDQILVAWAYRLISVAVEIGELSEYRGPWGFGVFIDGLAGVRAYRDEMNPYQRPIYEMGEYRMVSTAPSAEAREKPGAVVERLIGDLLVALGTIGEFEKEFAATRQWSE